MLDIFCISILFSECFGKNLCRKMDSWKDSLYTLHAASLWSYAYHRISPLQSSAVLTFSSCLDRSYRLLSFYCWIRASHLLNGRNWKWLCWKCKSVWMCVSVFCDNGKYLKCLFFLIHFHLLVKTYICSSMCCHWLYIVEIQNSKITLLRCYILALRAGSKNFDGV